MLEENNYSYELNGGFNEEEKKIWILQSNSSGKLYHRRTVEFIIKIAIRWPITVNGRYFLFT